MSCLEKLADVSQIVIAGVSILGLISIWVGYTEFKNQKDKDANDRVFLLIRLFREEVFKYSSQINKVLIDGFKNKIFPDNKLPVIELSDFSIESFQKTSRKTKDDFKDTLIKFISKDENLHENIKDILNIVEEFSTQIIFTKISDHMAFNTVKRAFVEIVSQYSAFLFYSKNIGEYPFSNTLFLYNKWVKECPPINQEERKKKVANLVRIIMTK